MENVVNLVHCRGDQFLYIVVIEVVALDKLIIQVAFVLEFLRARLGDTECIPVRNGYIYVIIATLVAVP